MSFNAIHLRKLKQSIDHYLFPLAQVTDWYVLRERLFTIGRALFFRKNTPWKAKFDRVIKSLVQTGIVEHWVKVRLRDDGSVITTVYVF